MEAFAEDRTFSEDELKLLANRMHTIKGGSGFFKLTELTKVTGQLEKLFGQGAQGISDKNLIQSLLTQFANCVENLVPPKAS